MSGWVPADGVRYRVVEEDAIDIECPCGFREPLFLGIDEPGYVEPEDRNSEATCGGCGRKYRLVTAIVVREPDGGTT